MRRASTRLSRSWRYHHSGSHWLVLRHIRFHENARVHNKTELSRLHILYPGFGDDLYVPRVDAVCATRSNLHNPDDADNTILCCGYPENLVQ